MGTGPVQRPCGAAACGGVSQLDGRRWEDDADTCPNARERSPGWMRTGSFWRLSRFRANSESLKQSNGTRPGPQQNGPWPAPVPCLSVDLPCGGACRHPGGPFTSPPPNLEQYPRGAAGLPIVTIQMWPFCRAFVGEREWGWPCWRKPRRGATCLRRPWRPKINEHAHGRGSGERSPWSISTPSTRPGALDIGDGPALLLQPAGEETSDWPPVRLTPASLCDAIPCRAIAAAAASFPHPPTTTNLYARDSH